MIPRSSKSKAVASRRWARSVTWMAPGISADLFANRGSIAADKGDNNEEGREPACRLPATGEQQGAERRCEGPEDHATPWEETAQAELQDERQDQTQRELPWD